MAANHGFSSFLDLPVRTSLPTGNVQHIRDAGGSGNVRLTLWAPFALTALSWVVQWQTGSHPRRGWLLFYAANFAWIAYAAFSDQPGFLFGGVVTSIIAIRNWRRAAV